MDRGRCKNRRGGGRRPYRGRGCGGDREYVHRGHRDGGRGRSRPVEPEKEEGNDVAEHQENEQQSSEFSRRKVLSNWDRYEASEKETESEVLQRGTDYSVLLSSAGDSFTQFRFADEKDWAAESPSSQQEELPQELPPFIAKGISNMSMFIGQRGSAAFVASDHDATFLPETKTCPDPSLPTYDEELDFLLSLEAPVTEKAATYPDGTREPDQLPPGEEQATSSVEAESCVAAEEKPNALTSEDLEDWLDSMIS
ncbi:cell death regulator Aven isoform X2 [Eleutherodactylus coqui]|uniref:cell death regulator Aven isoform X2 n=1 Tax=Eleutherodactylus coqui TaxID=57060 RepID=UPI003461AA75